MQEDPPKEQMQLQFKQTEEEIHKVILEACREEEAASLVGCRA